MPPVIIPPPPPPSDLIQSALQIPLNTINISHRGKKLRLSGQILGFDLQTSLLLLASPAPLPSDRNELGQIPTILVNISIPLLADSPAVNDLSYFRQGFSRQSQSLPLGPGELEENDDGWTMRPRDTSLSMNGSNTVFVNRQKLRLELGEFVSVVGWFEGESNLTKQINGLPSSIYARPLPIILEAIHISMTSLPEPKSFYRGQIIAWDGTPSTANPTLNGNDRDEVQDEDDWSHRYEGVTPKPFHGLPQAVHQDHQSEEVNPSTEASQI